MPKGRTKNRQELNKDTRPFDRLLFRKIGFPELSAKLWEKKDEVLTEDHLKLYTFIFYRTIATQMKNSIYNDSACLIQVNELIFGLKANKLIFDGWEVLGKKNILGIEIDDWKDREVRLPRLTIGDGEDTFVIDTDRATDKKARQVRCWQIHYDPGSFRNRQTLDLGRHCHLVESQKVCGYQKWHALPDRIRKSCGPMDRGALSMARRSSQCKGL